MKKSVSSVAYELEPNRFNLIVDRLARAIYFFHFGEKWLFNIRYQAEFLFTTKNQADEANLRLREISKQADEWFFEMDYFGDKISGKKGLKALIEEKYSQEDQEEIKPVEHILKKNMENTFKSLKDLSQYHPNRSVRRSLLQRIRALLARIMGKKK